MVLWMMHYSFSFVVTCPKSPNTKATRYTDNWPRPKCTAFHSYSTVLDCNSNNHPTRPDNKARSDNQCKSTDCDCRRKIDHERGVDCSKWVLFRHRRMGSVIRRTEQTCRGIRRSKRQRRDRKCQRRGPGVLLLNIQIRTRVRQTKTAGWPGWLTEL